MFPRHIKSLIGALVGISLCASVVEAGPVSYFGRLSVVGNRIKDEGKTQNVQLKGPSLFWSTYSVDGWYSQKVVDWMVDNANVSVVRAAMAIRYWKQNSEPIAAVSGDFGYLSPEEPNAKAIQKARIKRVVDAAIANDIYVIVDWHSHNLESGEESAAIQFFTEMATEYKDYKNLIWEVYNEPINWNPSSSNYAKNVIEAIRNAGSQNLILLGSSEYSSRPDLARNSNLHVSYSNIAYTLHFYAASHGASFRSNADNAMQGTNPAAVFVSEWGTTEYSGTGTVSQSTEWLSWMNNNSISSCNWSAYDGSGASSDMFSSGSLNQLSHSRWTTSGTIFRNYVGSGIATPSGFGKGANILRSINEGESVTLSSELALTGGTITGVSVLDPNTQGTASYTANSVTFNSAAQVGSGTVVVNYEITATAGANKNKQRITFNVNRKPTIKDTTLEVTWNGTSTIYLETTLRVTDPDLDPVTISGAISGGQGSIVIAADNKSFTYTPPVGFLNGAESRDDIFTYAATDGKTVVQKSLTIRVRNFAPTVYVTRTFTTPNTSPLTLTRLSIKAYDKDKDSITIASAQIMNTPYAGTLVIAGDQKSMLFTPAPNMIGTVVIQYTVTDGVYQSNVGTGSITVTGTGDQIPPYVVSLAPVVQRPFGALRASADWVQLTVPQSGVVSIDLYSAMGKKLQSIHQGRVDAGANQVSWNSASLPSGLYLVRVVQGSKSQVVRFLKR